MRADLDHLPAAKRRELERVTRILFEEFEDGIKTKLSEKRRAGRILKLILFGSYARGDWVEDRANGYISDYDLLIIVNTDEFTDLQTWWANADEHLVRALTVTRQLATPVNFIVHSLRDVNGQLGRGRPFFIDIARDGIALYEAPHHRLVVPRQLSPEEAQAEAQRHFDHWTPLTAHALKLARDSIADGVLRDAAFMVHQAAERAYSCLLLVLTLYRPKSHRLTILRSLAENLDARLIAAWPRDTRFARRAFARLERAYVDARYSHHYEISDEELAWLLDRAGELQATVATICAERLAGDAPAAGE